MAVCSFCKWSDRPGKTTHFDRKRKMWGWVPCPECGGTRIDKSIPTHAEAVAAREAKAS